MSSRTLPFLQLRVYKGSSISRQSVKRCCGKEPRKWSRILVQGTTPGSSYYRKHTSEASSQSSLDGYGLFSHRSHQEMRSNVLHKLERCIFPDLNPSTFSTLPSDCLEWKCILVQGALFKPFHGAPSLHQSVLPTTRTLGLS